MTQVLDNYEGEGNYRVPSTEGPQPPSNPLSYTYVNIVMTTFGTYLFYKHGLSEEVVSGIMFTTILSTIDIKMRIISQSYVNMWRESFFNKRIFSRSKN